MMDYELAGVMDYGDRQDRAVRLVDLCRQKGFGSSKIVYTDFRGKAHTYTSLAFEIEHMTDVGRSLVAVAGFVDAATGTISLPAPTTLSKPPPIDPDSDEYRIYSDLEDYIWNGADEAALTRVGFSAVAIAQHAMVRGMTREEFALLCGKAWERAEEIEAYEDK